MTFSLTACGGSDEKENSTQQSQQAQQSNDQQEDSNWTMGQKNAVKKAKDYLNVMAFSHDGLINQLEFDGFTNEEAVFGADNCNADWNEQAVKKAKEYLNTMSFSKDGLIKQLEFDGFTTEQAEYGVTGAGY